MIFSPLINAIEIFLFSSSLKLLSYTGESEVQSNTLTSTVGIKQESTRYEVSPFPILSTHGNSFKTTPLGLASQDTPASQLFYL